MIQFFRKIRRGLLSENKFKEYLLYAIGEILLIMIGILLALQVNNWNEGRKNILAEKSYLLGIKQDLKADSIFIEHLFPEYQSKNRDYHRLDSLIRYKADASQTDYTSLNGLLRNPRTFFPKVGTYNSMISQGRTNVIRNQQLLNFIQEVYEIEYVRMEKFGERIDHLFDKVLWEARFVRQKVQDNEDNPHLDQLRPDLLEMMDLMMSYVIRMQEAQKSISKCIDVIEKEVNVNSF